MVRGGIGVFIKNELLSKWNFEELDKEMDGLYFVRITNCDNDISIILSVCYLPPKNSSWALDCDAFFSHFTAFLYSMADETGLKNMNVSSYGTVNINMSNQFPDFKRFRFDNIPNDFMTGAQCVTDAQHLTDKCSILIPTQTSVDEVYKTFVTMHESEMNQRLKKSFLNGHKNASKHKHPPFWDEQLKSLFKEAK